jgi:hypothetical protein
MSTNAFTFEIDTPDLLRRVVLTLENHPEDGAGENWSISLELWERDNSNEDFVFVVEVFVKLDPIDFAGAQAIALEGLCVGQRAQALKAAEVVKVSMTDYATEDDDVRQAVRDIVHAA